MARRVPGPAGGKVRTFRPKAFDNHKDPEPIEIDIKQPTEAEKRELRAIEPSAAMLVDEKGEFVRDARGNLKLVVEDAPVEVKRAERVLEKHVTAVRNYVANTGEAITTGAELFKHGEAEIVREAVVEILYGKGLPAPEKKDFSAPPGSSSEEIPASNGTAKSAPLAD